MIARCVAVLGVVGAMLGLAGCGNSGTEELQQWMTEQRNQTRPKIEPVSEPKKFTPQNYTQERAVEPFSVQKLTQALKRESAAQTASAALVAPELRRRKEALEAFPLDAIAMVGSLVRDKQPMALLKVDNLIYQARLGNHIGQNYGRITQITETQMVLREIVQDAAGEWIERAATLQLQEKTK